MNGVEDHMHILCLSRKFAIMDVFKHSTTGTSKQIKKQGHKRMSFQDELRELCKTHAL